MSDTDTAHCRFCAKPKSYGKLVNFQTDDDRRRILVEKLFRLSLEVANFNSSHDALPKTVCFPCIDSLDKAFDFVINVEASQSELRGYDLITDVKLEVLDDDQVSVSCEEKYKEATVKIEVEISGEVVNNETEIESNITLNENEKSLKNTQNENETSLKNTLNENEKSTKNGVILNATPIQAELSWKDYSWLCAYCDIMFPSVEELKQHSLQSHGCCNPYRCTDCRTRKLNLDSFVKHVKQHKNNLKLSCYKCHKTFNRQYDAMLHKKDHIATEFICPGCNETFATKEQSIEHCNAYNKDKKIREVPQEHLTDDLRCVFCHKQFSNKGGLTTHLLTQHSEKKRDHSCEKCGKCFLNKANLSGHMLMHDDIRPYQCEICKNSFRQRSQLSRHMGIHDGKKPFACKECGRCFRLKKQLSTHSIVHTDIFPYVCSYCQKGFKHKSTLIQHERQHTGERPYKCQVCPREFTNWPNYNKHMKSRHGMNMAKSQQPPESLGLGNQTEGTEITLVQNINNFVPKKRGRPKTVRNKSKIKLLKYDDVKS